MDDGNAGALFLLVALGGCAGAEAGADGTAVSVEPIVADAAPQPVRGQWQCPTDGGEVVGDVGLLPDGGSMECVYDYAHPNQEARCEDGLAALLPVVGP